MATIVTTPRRPPGPASNPGRLQVASGLGRTMVVAGSLILAFASYQVWGTGLLEHYSQRALEAELEAQFLAAKAPPADFDPTIAAADPSTVPTTHADQVVLTAGADAPEPIPDAPSPVDATVVDASVASTPVATAPPPPAPLLPQMPLAEGDVIGRIEIPTIGVSKAVVHGVERETLRQGPGLYPGTARPGEHGNVAIAGHRTTHGAPFFDLDKLEPGDPITIKTVDGVFTYLVEGHRDASGHLAGHQIVDPSAVHVIGDHGDDRLTLTACHPKFSAQQRIVVSALLASGPAVPAGADDAAAPPPSTEPDPGVAVDLATTAGAEPAAASAAPPTAAATLPAAPTAESAEPEPWPTPQAEPAEQAEMEIAAADDLALLAAEPIDDSLGWQHRELDAAVLWATVAGLAVATTWLGGRLWRPRWVYPLSSPVVIGPLLVFFVHLDRLLPAI